MIKIFLLDGSYKTVWYNDNSTAGEVVSKICYSVNVALFEVKQDIRDSSAYQLVQADESLTNIISRWNLSGLKYAKLVLPLYDLQSAVKSDTIPRLTVLKRNTFLTDTTVVESKIASPARPSSTPNNGTVSPVRMGSSPKETFVAAAGGPGASKGEADDKGAAAVSGAPPADSDPGSWTPEELMQAFRKLQSEYHKALSERDDYRRKHDILKYTSLSLSLFRVMSCVPADRSNAIAVTRERAEAAQALLVFP